jgi:LacI family transcriptional regulator
MAAQPRSEEAWGYQAIADELREQIRAGVYLPGAFLPTERELQATYGVSRSTVRRAIAALAESGWAEVKPKRGVAAQLGPVTHLGGNVAYIDHADQVNQRVYFGLSQALQAKGFRLTHVDSRLHGVEGAIEHAADGDFVAAFVWSKEGFPDLARLENACRRMPFIALDHGIRGLSVDLVCADNLGGAAKVVEHLIAQGRRRIAISGMMDMLEINHDRFSGYLKALLAHGLQPSPKDFLFTRSSGIEQTDTTLLARRLLDADRPDAIFVMQDMSVPVIAEAIFDAGLRVPEDVAIGSFGGEMPIMIDSVGLTSAAHDWSSFVDEAVRALENRLIQPNAPAVQATIPVELIVQGSCGAAASMWEGNTNVLSGPLWQSPRHFLNLRSDDHRRTPSHMPTGQEPKQ